jgi:hypothetical protein
MGSDHQVGAHHLSAVRHTQPSSDEEIRALTDR